MGKTWKKLAASGMILALAGSFTVTAIADEKKMIRVGSKDFTENEIVAELYALALENAGYNVERIMDISSSVIHTSIVNDEIDLYPEYTGTGLISILKMEPLTDEQEVFDTVKNAYASQYDLVWLDYAPANDGQGLFISKKASDEYGITTISELQEHAEKLRFASQGSSMKEKTGCRVLKRYMDLLTGHRPGFMTMG